VGFSQGSAHDPSQAKRAGITLRCIRLASYYFDQTIACSEKQAYFAASVMGCSVLETVLMLACIRDSEGVLRTKKWKDFHQKNRRRGKFFDELLPWIDLGHLIGIGTELKWFPEDDKISTLFHASRIGVTPLRNIQN
jgi:hypothetical protein